VIDHEGIGYFRASALIARACGDFSLANTYEEHAHQLRMGNRLLIEKGLACSGFAVPTDVVSAALAVRAVNLAYCGDYNE
jgi:hypothetical protein